MRNPFRADPTSAEKRAALLAYWAAWHDYERRSAAAKDDYYRGETFPTDDEAREAHDRYLRGARDEATVTGERRYQRDRKREFRRNL